MIPDQVLVHREIDDIRSERIEADPNGTTMDMGLGKVRAKLDANLKRDLLVAVVDSGLDLGHEDISANIYRNKAECDGDKLPFKPTVDKDGNGYIGDCMGWNFTAKAEAGDNNPEDDLGHGTHIAGILAAKVGNGIGIAGVSDRIKFIPIKVTSRRDNSSLTHKVAKAILFATKMKADVINFSLGWPVIFDAEFLRQAFSEARKAGIVIVAAAGNNTSAAPVFPCSYEGVICVGATSINGEVAGFSNYGGHVDMMGPGEQILSLFPKARDPEQFSVKGYEIKNGTSQSSPYVASAAAILKGLLPNASVDEIQARLTLGGKSVKWGEKYALAGSADVGLALATTAQPVVQPVFKTVYQVPFKMAARDFKFSLPIKNYWAKANDVNVKVTFESKAAALDQTTFALGAVDEGETKIISLSGQISDVEGAREARLKVSISVNGNAARTYQQQVVLTRVLEGDAKIQAFPIRLALANQPKLDLFSIKSLRENESYPDYVHFEQLETGISFKLIRWKGAVFQEETPILLPNAKQLLFAWRADLNGDGRGDYIIATITQKGEDESTKTLQYTLLRDDLTPVFGRQANLPVVVDGAVIDEDGIKSMSLVTYPTSVGSVAMMAFMTDGSIPKPDLNPDPFDFEVNSNRKRLYYYEPKQENGEWKLVTRSYDNGAWEKSIRQKLSLPFREDVAISALLPQTDEDVRAGRLKALVKIGSSTLKRYRVISIAGGKQLASREYTMTSASFKGQTYEGSEMSSVISLDDESPKWHAAPALASFYSANQGRLSVLDGNDPSKLKATQVIESVRKQDRLLGYIQGFMRGQTTYAFYQSQSQLIVRTTGPGVDARDNAAIDRSSLLPGKVFNAMFFPVARGASGPKEPAIYVDTTQLSSSRVYLWTIEQGRLIAPMHMNVEIPKNCRAMAPRRFGTRGEWSYVLLCNEGNGSWALKTLAIE
ncbi:MAG: S8 family peptidase [Bdellovibrionota bacterium]